MSNVKLSIITVCYNAGGTIRDTFDSVLSQTFQEYEYIVKDGGSVDDTENIVLEYKAKFEDRGIRFKYICGKDINVYDAMNIATEAAEGVYINYLNADDMYVCKEVLEQIFSGEDYKIYKDYDILYGDNLEGDEEGRGIRRADIRLITKKLPFNHQSCFVKSSLMKANKYNLNYGICADYDLILTLYEKGARFCYVNQIVAYYKLNGISSTNFRATLSDRENIRLEHKIVKTKRTGSYLAKYIEATIKDIIQERAPGSIKTLLRLFYKKYIKKYEEME